MLTTRPAVPPQPTASPGTGGTAQRAAKLIADNLGNLPHPGNTNDRPRQMILTQFATTGLPDELAKAVNAAAQTIGEAIVELLRANNIQLTDTT